MTPILFSKKQRTLCIEAAKDMLQPNDRKNPKYAFYELSKTLEGAIHGGDDSPEGKEFGLEFSNLWCSTSNRKQKEAIRKEIYEAVSSALEEVWGGDSSESVETDQSNCSCGKKGFVEVEGRLLCEMCAEHLTCPVF